MLNFLASGTLSPLGIDIEPTAELKLSRSEEKFRLLFEHSPVGMAMVDHATGDFLEVNQSVLQSSGYTREEFLNLSYWDITPKEYEAQEIAQIEDLNRCGHFGPNEKEYFRKDGTRYPVKISGFILTDVDGRKVVWGILEDITERKRAEEAYERLEAAALAGVIGTWEWDAVKERLIWDKVMYRLHGLHDDSVDSAYEVWSRAIHPEDKARVASDIDAALHGKREFESEYRIVWPDGSIRYIKAVSHTTFDGSGKPLRMVGVNYDLTEQKTIQIELDKLAFYDRLTKLPNRRLLEDRLGQLIARAERSRLKMSLLYIDLDKFKPVNDEYGHATGDWLLRRVAERIQECIRQSDTAARLGGDEFVVVLQDAGNICDVTAVAEKIRESLDKPFLTQDGKKIEISSSIGIVIYPDHANNLRDLLHFGDEAMYRAKKSGRNAIEVFAASGTKTPAITENHLIFRIDWKPNYACGEATIDQEHQGLLLLANTLIDLAIRREADPERFNKTFDTLLSTIVQHFEHEEKILRTHNYDSLSEHAEQHQLLIKHMNDLRKQSEESDASIGKLIDFIVSDIVVGHMAEEDSKFHALFQGES